MYGAYHWGVLLAPKKSNGCDNTAYDVSDGVRLDSETGQDLNPERDWFFRIKNDFLRKRLKATSKASSGELHCRIRNQEKGVAIGFGMPYPSYKMHR
ncbi:hypothetical protein FQN52_004457 [Onygenales sp. PD_12]|nr:hypothetical protein FQN52_004457 [Onygenales sp. PD_12]